MQAATGGECGGRRRGHPARAVTGDEDGRRGAATGERVTRQDEGSDERQGDLFFVRAREKDNHIDRTAADGLIRRLKVDRPNN